MRTADLISALVWLGLGLGAAYSGSRLGLGRLVEPGSGFLIFYAGLAMAVLGAALGIAALRGAAGPSVAELWAGLKWRKPLIVVGLLIVYAAVFSWVGFIALTLPFLVFLFRVLEGVSWRTSLIVATLTTVSMHLLFSRWLGAQLPRGTLLEGLAAWI